MKKYVEKKQHTGIISALSLLGLILGLTGLLGSLIPCTGILALYISVPAVLVSCSSLFLSYQRSIEKVFPLTALAISILGLAISLFQYISASTAVNEGGKIIGSILN